MYYILIVDYIRSIGLILLSHLLAYCEDQDRVNTTFYVLENLAESEKHHFL